MFEMVERMVRFFSQVVSCSSCYIVRTQEKRLKDTPSTVTMACLYLLLHDLFSRSKEPSSKKARPADGDGGTAGAAGSKVWHGMEKPYYKYWTDQIDRSPFHNNLGHIYPWITRVWPARSRSSRLAGEVWMTRRLRAMYMLAGWDPCDTVLEHHILTANMQVCMGSRWSR